MTPVVRHLLGSCRVRVRRAVRTALGRPRIQLAPLVHVDSPPPGSTVTTPYLLVAGWIGADADAEVTDLQLVDDTGRTFEVATVDRPDAEASHATRRVVGYQRLLRLDEVASCRTLRLDATVGDHLVRHEVMAAGAGVATGADELRAAKERKAARIRPLLRCPRCTSTELRDGPLDGPLDGAASLTCAGCASSFPTSPGHGVDFLPDDLRERFRITATERISAWGYDARTTAIVDRHRGGLVLDCGCGLRPDYRDNVVNYEIVDYPTTDVLGVGQALPFVDGAFDAVFSFAVLEHVTDPFRCAAELVRVLKPGGTLFAIVPFLQPFHGYPDHYYNMTSSGLRHLFAHDDLEIAECDVPDPGRPIFALSWMLNSYAQGLPPEVAARFARMRVSELMAEPATLLDRDIVSALSAAATTELAATNYLVAVKRSGLDALGGR